MSLTAGSRLGPYEILSPLGAGGMGEVYRARDAKLQREVAVKVLPERVASDPEALARFEREARAVAAISHPNILAIHDFGRDGDVTYAVTELLEGETLRAALSGGPLAPRKAADYAVQTARGLAAAHEKGIVHRDLKPDNIFVTRDGRVKILDFGLARPTAAMTARDDTRSPTVTSHTEPGAVLGTVGYMSPEQVRGLPADARSDIFSFGAVLYEMLAGRRAFEGGSQVETMVAILQSDPPEPEGSGKTPPPGLERMARRCLEKKPEQRFQSASDLAFALESASTASGPVGAEPIGGIAPGRLSAAGPLLWLALGAVLSGAVVFLALGGAHRGPAAVPAPPVRFTIPPPVGAAFEGMLALSPDGRTLAFVAATADGRDLLFLRPLDSLDARPVPGTEGAAYPFWSPDGRALAFFAQERLKRIDLSGGSPQTLCSASGARGGSWGSAGEIVLAAETGAQMKVVSASGGEPRPLAHLQSKRGESYRWPTFLPDGRHFLYFALTGDPAKEGVWWTSVDSKETGFVAVADSGALFTPQGYLIYRSGDRLLARSFDQQGLRVTGEAVPLVEDVWWDGISTLATAFTISPGGTLAYQTGGLSLTQLLLYDRTGSQIRSVGPPSAYLEPAFSPDGRRVAVGRTDPAARGATVWVMDLERGTATRLSSSSAYASTPVWSPDGRSVAYCEFPSGQVYVRDASGAEKEKLLFTPSAFSPLDDWSLDGRYLLHEIVEWPNFHFHIALRDLRDGSDRPLLQESSNLLGARFSPDGRWLAYESEGSGVREVFIQSFPGPGDRRQISTGGGTQPRWRGDGKEIFFISPDRKLMAADIRTQPALDSGAPHALFQTRILPTVEARNHYDVTSDGQRFIVNSHRLEDAALPITVVAPWTPASMKR